jgi:hypothetical protein
MVMDLPTVWCLGKAGQATTREVKPAEDAAHRAVKFDSGRISEDDRDVARMLVPEMHWM